MSRTTGNTNLLDLPLEVRLLIFEEIFQGLEHQLRFVKETASDILWLQNDGYDPQSAILEIFTGFENRGAITEDAVRNPSWLPKNSYGPLPEVLFICKLVYREARPIYARSLVLNFATRYETDETPTGLKRLSQLTAKYYYQRVRRIRSSRLGLVGIPWQCMRDLQRVEINLEAGYDGGTAYIASSCSEENANAYLNGDRDQILTRCILREAQQGRFGGPSRTMLNMKERSFSVTLTSEIAQEVFEPEGYLLLTFDVDTLVVLYRRVTDYKIKATVEWNGRWIRPGRLDHLGRHHTTDGPKVKWVKEAAVAEVEEDYSDDVDWPESWQLPA